MRNSIYKIFLLWFLLGIGINAWSATGHALVIGIGEYQDPAWDKINGDRDVALVVEMVEALGYQDVVTLVNKAATKSAIIDALEKLVGRCAKDDRVYIHFSGHGQRMTDLNGDEMEDGWDESWIPYDAYLEYGVHDRGEKHLSDDEVGEWMTRLRKVVGEKGQIVLSVDACHSGDSSRDLDDAPVRGVIRNFIIPHEKSMRTPKIPETWLTLSACKSFQRNCEVRTDDGFYGMLSYALHCLYQQMRGKDNSEVLNLLKSFVNSHRGTLPQTPQLTGESHKYKIVQAFYN